MTDVVITTEGDVVIATIDVDVDIANTDAIGAAIIEAVPNGAVGLLIDLRGVRYLDSAGIRMLFAVVRELDACRQRVAISIEEDSPLRKLLKITNLDEVVYVCASHDDCILGLHEGRIGGL